MSKFSREQAFDRRGNERYEACDDERPPSQVLTKREQNESASDGDFRIKQRTKQKKNRNKNSVVQTVSLCHASLISEVF